LVQRRIGHNRSDLVPYPTTLPDTVHDPSMRPLRIEIRQGFDLRFQWVLVGRHGSLAISPYFLRKEACWRALRPIQKDCGAPVEDCTFTAPLEAA